MRTMILIRLALCLQNNEFQTHWQYLAFYLTLTFKCWPKITILNIKSGKQNLKFWAQIVSKSLLLMVKINWDLSLPFNRKFVSDSEYIYFNFFLNRFKQMFCTILHSCLLLSKVAIRNCVLWVSSNSKTTDKSQWRMQKGTMMYQLHTYKYAYDYTDGKTLGLGVIFSFLFFS